MSDKHAAGKGSRYRPVDQDKYRENYEAIFGKPKKETKNDRSKDSKTDNRRRDSKQDGRD